MVALLPEIREALRARDFTRIDEVLLNASLLGIVELGTFPEHVIDQLYLLLQEPEFQRGEDAGGVLSLLNVFWDDLDPTQSLRVVNLLRDSLSHLTLSDTLVFAISDILGHRAPDDDTRTLFVSLCTRANGGEKSDGRRSWFLWWIVFLAVKAPDRSVAKRAREDLTGLSTGQDEALSEQASEYLHRITQNEQM